jgi:hypothetical protein
VSRGFVAPSSRRALEKRHNRRNIGSTRLTNLENHNSDGVSRSHHGHFDVRKKRVLKIDQAALSLLRFSRSVIRKLKVARDGVQKEGTRDQTMSSSCSLTGKTLPSPKTVRPKIMEGAATRHCGCEALACSKTCVSLTVLVNATVHWLVNSSCGMEGLRFRFPRESDPEKPPPRSSVVSVLTLHTYAKV